MKKTAYLILLVIIGLWSCSAPKKVVKKKESLPLERILKKTEAQRRKIKTFRATGLLKVFTSKFEGKGTFEILIKKPDSLKISIFGPFGISVAEALITNNNFVYYDELHNVVYSGKRNDKLISRIFKFSFPTDDLFDFLVGRKNLTDKIYSVPDSIDFGSKEFTLYFKGKNNAEEIYRFKNPSNDLLFYSFTSGNKIIEASFNNFKTVNGFNIPYKIKIKYGGKSEAIIDYRSTSVNGELSSLIVKVPTDAKKVEW